MTDSPTLDVETLRELELYDDTDEARAARVLLRAIVRALDLDENAGDVLH